MLNGSARQSGFALTDKQRLAWLRLIRSENVGPSTFRDLIDHFGSAEAALDALPELSQRGGSRRSVRVCSIAEAEREIDIARKTGARFVGIGEADYPVYLRQIDAAPPLLAMRGNPQVAARPSIGIVGSRNASISGAKIAAMIARDAGRAGYAVISGLARGIDTAAHQASLDTGTIAAMAGGLDQPYPPENRGLLEDIGNGAGLAISEMPFGWEPRARDFPRRNRLIAGASLGLVVVEAALRSGSLITARLAAEYGRLVFAVPGSPLDPRCQGTNGLLKDGAIVTTGVGDVLEALAPISRPDLFSEPHESEVYGDGIVSDAHPPNDDDRGRLVTALGPTPAEIDDVIRYTGLAPSSVYLLLLELDLAGRLQRHSGGMVSLTLAD
ncbi:DNA-processing protein DprA [Rhizobiaceae bacterium n13]|uniref:DNA-processing protein DprA n=1 Tax=Ferirhizobium litorale TaxID=2927786 RepID=A0AAE3QJW8_9HYPH|nr:DNA-processing protein DprA [Fererhizobium litorale]MDI7864390.1 DNA-processing protein DprA [Fererhizobium litorale]MDI7924696.1 DNA-processing protein DprA [Fererhizobium litorale]